MTHFLVSDRVRVEPDAPFAPIAALHDQPHRNIAAEGKRYAFVKSWLYSARSTSNMLRSLATSMEGVIVNCTV
ncbi:MAG: hypothetical protein WA354_02460 [Terracidiphilus sp.]